MSDKLLLATNNRNKVREYKSLLGGLPYALVTPAEEGINMTVEEVGGSLEDNARIKAEAFARESRLLCLADDSGLEVDALDGEPGPLSARYAGEGATDAERIDYLLAKLKDVPSDRRTARFRAVIALGQANEGVELFCGECRGYVTFEPKGEHGFGYDPVFYLPELDRTMAELPPEVKNRVSHRAQAARKARRALEKLAGREHDRTV